MWCAQDVDLLVVMATTPFYAAGRTPVKEGLAALKALMLGRYL